MDVPLEMVAALEDNMSLLLSLAGVAGIDIGFSELNEEPTENLAIRVFVSDIDTIPEGIPDSLAGFPVFVLERNFLPQADLTRHEPLVGGVSVARGGSALLSTDGTLGGIARENVSGDLRGLSCAHIFDMGIGVPGDRIEQPQPNPSPQPKNVIGNFLRASFPTVPSLTKPFLPTGACDAAICTITRSAAAAIADIGPVNGTAIPLIGDKVIKRGKTTGLTHGTVSGVSVVRGGQNGSLTALLIDQIEITNSEPSSFFSDRGDSGSLIVKEDTREILGLLWGGSIDSSSGVPDGRFAIACKIDNVETELGISLFWPIPQISSLTPDSGSSKGGDTVTITGTGFQLASTVTIGGVPVTFALIDDRQIIVKPTPPGTGPADVLVTAPGGTSLVGRPESTFTYVTAGKTTLISPRFLGEDVLASCLSGHRIFDGSGDPPDSVAVLQQALSDLGSSLSVDGNFGAETGDAVTAFKSSRNISPDDPVVGPETMSALDEDFAHELIDARANDVAGTAFDLGDRLGTRVDLEDGFATCDFQNGICVEIGHVVAYAMPALVQAAWVAAGGLEGAFGEPTGNPVQLDPSRSVQEFASAAFVFGDAGSFALPLDLWQTSIAGGSMIGLPLGPPQAAGTPGAVLIPILVPHDRGVVLAVPEAAPQPLPQAVFDLWDAQEAAGTSIGPPTGFAFPSASGTTIFPFLTSGIELNNLGIASLVGPVSDDLRRYFQPEDDAVFLKRPLAGVNATPIVGGLDAFKSMHDDIAATTGEADFVYILSWHCNVDLELIPGDPASSLRALLTACAARKVQVRAMLWAGDVVPPPPPFILPLKVAIPWQMVRDYANLKTSHAVNDPAVQFMNGLLATGNDSAAILDDRHLPMGSHHQKVVVVGRGGRLVAYVGGIEPNVDRIPPPIVSEHGSPYFDISVRLEDAGAWLVMRSFILRWTAHPNHFGAPLRGDGLPVPLPNGPLVVQVTGTYGGGFPFPVAVHTASTALANGIRRARQFFYMEDQYFVGSPKMDEAIRNAMTSNPALIAIIVIAAEDSVTDLPDIAFRRRAFLGPLVTLFAGRVLVFERLGGGVTTGPTAYVHSKLLIVDDEAAFIGSVNSNRRSWFHDSEIGATIVDGTGSGGAAPGTRGWAREFRCTLWSQHLNLPSSLLGDFATALTFWQAVASGSSVVSGAVVSVRGYDATAVVPRYSIDGVSLPDALLQKVWDTLEDPS